MRRLIVNADDLGLTPGVNRAIRETHVEGIVTSATLMACGSAFEDAAGMARALPGLSVGCHVVLVDGIPLSDPGSVPSLLAPSASPAQFPSSLGQVAVRAVLRRFDHDELVGEVVTQIRKLQSAGLQVTHLDAHKHTHMFPEILHALVQAARVTGVPAIRNPFVPPHALRAGSFLGETGLWKRYAQVRLLRVWSSGFQDKVRRAGLAAPDGALAVIETGSMTADRLRRALTDLPQGTWELVCHPGYNDAGLRAARTRLLGSRDEERQLLTSSWLREFLAAESIRLIGYREFAGS